MRNSLLVLALLGILPAPAFADVTKNDLKTLVAAGISEPVIVAFVKSHGPLARLSPDDLIDLKKSGASESLLAAVLSVQPPAAASNAAEPVAPGAPVATPSYTAVYPGDYSSAYYSYPAYDDYGYPCYGYYGYPYPWYGFGVGFGLGRFGRFGHFGHPGFFHFSGGHAIVRHSGSVGGFHGGFGGGHGGFAGGHGGHR